MIRLRGARVGGRAGWGRGSCRVDARLRAEQGPITCLYLCASLPPSPLPIFVPSCTAPPFFQPLFARGVTSPALHGTLAVPPACRLHHAALQGCHSAQCKKKESKIATSYDRTAKCSVVHKRLGSRLHEVRSLCAVVMSSSCTHACLVMGVENVFRKLSKRNVSWIFEILGFWLPDERGRVGWVAARLALRVIIATSNRDLVPCPLSLVPCPLSLFTPCGNTS